MRYLYLLYRGSESTKNCWYLQTSPFLFQVIQVLVTWHAYIGCDYTILLNQNRENRPLQLMINEVDRLDAFTRLSGMELLQDSVHCKLKTTHACCIAGRTQESMMPISRHIYPKWNKGPKMSQHVKKFVLASLPPCQAVMNKTQASQSWFIYGNMSIWTTSYAGNQLSMDGHFPIVIKCHSKCAVKMMDLLVMTMTLMMNAWHLLRMKVNKIEGRLTYAMNAPINIIWRLNIWQCSMWCFYSFLTYSSVLHVKYSHGFQY